MVKFNLVDHLAKQNPKMRLLSPSHRSNLTWTVTSGIRAGETVPIISITGGRRLSFIPLTESQKFPIDQSDHPQRF